MSLHVCVCVCVCLSRQVWFQNMRARDRRRISSTPLTSSSLPSTGLASVSAMTTLPLIATMPSGFPSHSISLPGAADILMNPFVGGLGVAFNLPEQNKPLDLSTKTSVNVEPLLAPSDHSFMHPTDREGELTGAEMVLDLSTRSAVQVPSSLNGAASPAVVGPVDCVTDAAYSEPLDCSSTAYSSSSSASSSCSMSAETAHGDSLNGWSSSQDGRHGRDGDQLMTSSPCPRDYKTKQRASWHLSADERREVCLKCFDCLTRVIQCVLFV